ncbi:MAG: MogA/MoaB family molybdenum cofactor biosynthesis protein [Planctomycetes bacterium]|nr:MogA/MoaB family molybdenum cofactor biosynthesis protein [Planctomycetota bacterium]
MTPVRAAILTISDKGSQGMREDRSGQVIREMLPEIPAVEVAYEIIPDEAEVIEARLRALCAKADVVLTTGGTGVAPRDVTPEATRRVIDKELPGFGEAIRMESLKKTPFALVSRAMAGIAGRTLIVNLPGSPKAVRECLAVVLPAIEHTVEKAQGDPSECAPARDS